MPSWKKQSEAFRQAIKQAEPQIDTWWRTMRSFGPTTASCKSVSIFQDVRLIQIQLYTYISDTAWLFYVYVFFNGKLRKIVMILKDYI